MLLPSSLLDISNLCLRGMSLFPGEAVNAALSASDSKGGITTWQSIASQTRGYTVMANYHLRDKTLSLKAVGLLSKMLSFNDGWQFSTKGLSAICKEGPDAVLAALRELEDAGYLVRHQSRDEKGRMSSMVFEIYEKPQRVYRTRKSRIRKSRTRIIRSRKNRARKIPHN